MKPGDILNNGAKVIAVSQDYVLASWEKGTGTEYITWRFDDLSGACYWGHYFSSLYEAAKDFASRILAEQLENVED